MKITYVRHGQTDYNLYKIFQADAPLNSTGIKQAKETAKKLKDKHFDICYCSPMLRTRQTLNEILKYHNDLKVIFDERLHERHYGELIGQHASVVTFNRWDMTAKIPYKGMESIPTVIDRVSSFYDDLFKTDYQNVLIVAHSGIFRASSVYFYGIPKSKDLSEYKLQNGEVATFEK